LFKNKTGSKMPALPQNSKNKNQEAPLEKLSIFSA
jgi:hypothetical protein